MNCFLSRRALIPALFVLAACGGGPKPTTSVSDGVVQAGTSNAAVSAAELDDRVAALFGDALKVDASLSVSRATESLPIADEEPTWDIDVRSYETVDRVQYYVAHFSGRARSYFEDRLSRGSRYETMIRQKLSAGDLPEDMYYLAFVESGYDPNAYSRAAAVGMWQFMTATGRGMGLRIDWWIDERRDPVRSTDAAVRFLRGLREQFGSMYLAAAAYNGGPGRVARGLSRYADDFEGDSPDDMFFTLAEKKYLRNETRDYVPQLIAAALVAKEASRYGVSIAREEPFQYDSVKVGPRVSMAAIADAAGVSVADLQRLNPHILRGMTPPSDSAKVRIPLGTRVLFDSAFVLLDDDVKSGAEWITAEKGATWASLGREGGVSARSISSYNPKVKASKSTGRIPAGTRVLVPSPRVVAAALSVPDPSIERYGTGTRTHVVRRGENLSVIAKRYRTTPSAIMRMNRLKKPLIFPGQELLVRRSR
jgi:membrane-bound lytic murein transglycosylase D